MTDNLERGARILVEKCANLKPGEKAYIISDPQTDAIAELVFVQCRRITDRVRRDMVQPTSMHGAPPTTHVGESMLWADAVFCLTSMSMAHTQERKKATDNGTRFLSLPDYTLELLGGDSLLFDFKGAAPFARELAEILNQGSEVRVTTAQGSDFRFSIAERMANCCPGICPEPGTLGSPPDAEVNIAPIEDSAEGVVCIDGSIPCREIGALKGRKIRLSLSKGCISKIEGDDEIAQALNRLFTAVGSPVAKVLGEFGVGINSKASLTGRMLEDEGCAGTVHLGFGSNSTIGGQNSVAFHLDFVMIKPTVWVDGRRIMNAGAPEWGSGAFASEAKKHEGGVL